MSVYIEYVIIDNMVLTYAISDLTYRILLGLPSRKRCLLCSVVATVVAVWYPFVKNNVALIAIKVVLLIVLGCILFIGKSRFVLGCIVFLLLTFAFGGAVFAVNYLILPEVVGINAPIGDFSLGLIVVLCVALWLLARKVFIKTNKARLISDCMYPFQVSIAGKIVSLNGFIDTGNRLFDSVSGLPIVVVRASKIMECFTDEQLCAMVVGGKVSVGRKSHYITYTTVAGGNNRMLLIEPDFFRVKTKRGYDNKSVMVGISFSPIRDDDRCDAILHPSIT